MFEFGFILNFKFIEITGHIGIAAKEYKLIVAFHGLAVNFYHKSHKVLAPSKSPPVGETF
jgi:hypothetical protein